MLLLLLFVNVKDCWNLVAEIKAFLENIDFWYNKGTSPVKTFSQNILSVKTSLFDLHDTVALYKYKIVYGKMSVIVNVKVYISYIWRMLVADREHNTSYLPTEWAFCCKTGSVHTSSKRGHWLTSLSIAKQIHSIGLCTHMRICQVLWLGLSRYNVHQVFTEHLILYVSAENLLSTRTCHIETKAFTKCFACVNGLCLWNCKKVWSRSNAGAEGQQYPLMNSESFPKCLKLMEGQSLSTKAQLNTCLMLYCCHTLICDNTGVGLIPSGHIYTWLFCDGSKLYWVPPAPWPYGHQKLLVTLLIGSQKYGFLITWSPWQLQ